MCGILFILLQNGEEDLNKIRDGFLTLKNRGPDRGIFSYKNNCIVCFQRLCINDLSLNGDQPFISDSGSILECNGEIFNHNELKVKHNIICKSNSDCEVILHLTEKIGIEECVKELNGDYAFFIKCGNYIHFVRDISGVRPLFYGITKYGNIACASTSRSLLGFCKIIGEIPPGITSYDINNNTFSKIERYIGNIINTDNIETLLIKSVKDRLISDRPIGCLLSGGLDSSLIASILCKLLGNKNVRTYSIGFEGSSDLQNAEIVSKYLGTNHTSITINIEDVLLNIHNIIKDLESYDITTVRASIPMWILSKYIKTNTDDIVLFSGEGADELFCGYLYFHYAPSLEELLKERERLYMDMYKYDCLRADRCVSSNGLEIRVPFLDKNIINHAFSLEPSLLHPKHNHNIEKYYMRNAFRNGYLPDDILWRRKDGFSDGVTKKDKEPWYKFYERSTFLIDYDKSKYVSKEAQHYKEIYDTFFNGFDLERGYWMPKWIDTKGDPSGRKLPVFN